VTPRKPPTKQSVGERLEKLGLRSDIDYVLHLPMRYEDETRITPIDATQPGAGAQIEAVVTDVQIRYRPRRQLVVQLADSSGEMTLRFINFYASQVKHFDVGTRIRARGELRAGYAGREMIHPRYQVVTEDVPLPDRLTPVYPAGEGITQGQLRTAIARALARADLSDTLPPPVLERYRLEGFEKAVRLLHNPAPEVPQALLFSRTHPAWVRIKFDELVSQQLSLKRAQAARREQTAHRLSGSTRLVEAFLATLPFRLTRAQERVWSEIRDDLAQPYPMQRLLQGDVGSGKTVVAALAACQAIDNGFQAALMAPTEILAEQHFKKLAQWLEALGVSVAWLTGSLKKKARDLVRARIEGGDASLVIGTHALIQEGVEFARLGLAIVDEQQRFGVEQRLALRAKSAGGQPHQLMMSATPIPRTLAMTYYADLEVSTIDELPPGRKPVLTRVFDGAKRAEVIERVAAAIRKGQQAYWVCPLIEESEALDLQTAVDTHAALALALPDVAVGLVHGRMAPGEKASIMAAFVAGGVQLLVATTVIEVGVDVPNAALMVIEHAERFGLAQLHQLRGRIGRGALESACILLYQGPLSALARERLSILRSSSDGFEIARRDLELRGPGEFLGQRQSGMALLRFVDLETDQWLVEQSRDASAWLLRDYSEYADRHLERWLGGREDFLKA
jgi:ATP-dependent DNA helicase RecG